jgi:type II secretory pathway pseudopilin PulG
MTNHKLINRKSSGGLTIVELLVVVSILSILTALMIPRLRMVNKDRAIREAARTVGSQIAKAVDRAASDNAEIAGILIERNPNLFEEIAGTNNTVHFAGTRMFVLRSVAPYAGDSRGDLTCEITVNLGANPPNMVVQIPRPLEWNATNNYLRTGDRIRLNHGSVRYRVLGVSPNTFTKLIGGVAVDVPVLDLTVGLGQGNSLPAVQGTTGVPIEVPYLIYRRPRKLQSSKVDLPAGYMVDMRFSGPALPSDLIQGAGAPESEIAEATNTATYCRRMAFGQDTTEAATATQDVEILFGSSGEVDSYTFNFENTSNVVVTRNQIPIDPFYLFVTTYEPDESHNAPDSATSSLYDPNAMWVSIDHRTGSVNVAYNNPPAPGSIAPSGNPSFDNFAAGLITARAFASGKASAD